MISSAASRGPARPETDEPGRGDGGDGEAAPGRETSARRPRAAAAAVRPEAWPALAMLGLCALLAAETTLLAAFGLGAGEALLPGGDHDGVLFGASLAAAVLGGALAAVTLTRAIRASRADRDGRAQAEAALRARDEFLGLAAHELKTPLTALFLELGAAGRDAARRGDAAAKGHLSRADRAARRLAELVSRLLVDARAAAEPLALEEVDLGALAHDAVDARRELFDRARCDVTVRAEGPVSGRWDRTRLDRALSSLLANAAKYGQGRPIEVTVRAEGAQARLSVRDHGIGIPPERRAAIFDRYARAVSARHYGGLGLGLWIARREALALGGTVTVESRPGHGAEFTLRLPAGALPPLRRIPRAAGGALARAPARALRWLAWRSRRC